MSNVLKVIGGSAFDIYQFNMAAGNLENVGVDSVDNQASFIFEELTEMIDGIEGKNPKEVLDGAVDTFVTAVGQLLKLEAAGFDVASAMTRIDKNNLSKFIRVKEVADSYRLRYDVVFHEETGFYVLKDKVTGKIKKPDTFQSVSLADLVNAKFFEKE